MYEIGKKYSFSNYSKATCGHCEGVLKEIWFENIPEHTRYLAELEYFEGKKYEQQFTRIFEIDNINKLC